MPLAMDETPVQIVVEDIAKAPVTRNILIHGPSGGGKTLLAGGAANGGRRVVFLSTETDGIAPVRAIGAKAELIRCSDWDHAASGISWAEDNMTLDDWLVVDTGTKMQEFYRNWILARQKQINPLRDIDILAWQEYQKFYNGFKRWTDRIIDGPFNSIFICQSMAVDDGEEERIVPLLLGRKGEISEYVSAQFSVALYYGVARESRDMEGAITRRALCQPYPPWFAKDRYSALGKTWDVPEGEYWEMAKMIEAIDTKIRKGVGENGARATGASRSVARGPGRPAGRVAAKARR